MLFFHATLLKMGRFRLGISKRFSGASLLIMSIFALTFYLMYWTLLLTLWMIYGMVWISCIIPIKIFKYLNKCRDDAKLEAAGVPKILRSDVVFWLSVVFLPPLAYFIIFIREDKTLINRILCGICAAPFAILWFQFIFSIFK